MPQPDLSRTEQSHLARVLERLLRSDDYVSYRAGYLTIDSSVPLTRDEIQAIERVRLIAPRRS